MKTPEQVALEVVGQLSFSSNRMLNGRLVGEQYFAAQAVSDAIRNERAEAARLRAILFEIQCEQLALAANSRLKMAGFRRRAMQIRNKILEALDRDDC